MNSQPHTLSTLLLERAERDAWAPCLVDGDRHMTAEAVAHEVARLGSALRARGVGPGDRVMVFAPKSAEAFIAMHAALYIGAIAVPVNPQSPPDLVAMVANDIQPAAVVLHPATVGRFPNLPVVTVGAPLADASLHINEDELAETNVRGPSTRSGADPAYIITTSGSTGRPKSIVHTHHSGLRYAQLAADCYRLGADDRMANIAPFHFDQSTFELYAAPLVGATVVLVPEVLLRFPASVSELIEREQITTWYSVPTILRQLLERGALETRDLSSLRWVLFGGEVFPAAQLRQLMERLPQAWFSNVYGPAEVNQCMFHHLETAPAENDSIPIGVAWDDTELRIVADGATVDDHQVLDGAVTGELEVATATAMAGYWGRPDLTDDAFRTEVTPGELTRRWYRTGDRVTRDAAGVHHFLGRSDRQVKIRGIRVELEAVEDALGAVPGVTAAAAIATNDPASPLVGIVESTTVEDEKTVRAAIASRLVPGTAPDSILIVPALPRTSSGKVDTVAAADLLTTQVHR